MFLYIRVVLNVIEFRVQVQATLLRRCLELHDRTDTTSMSYLKKKFIYFFFKEANTLKKKSC